jgi:hypothetical protein
MQNCFRYTGDARPVNLTVFTPIQELNSTGLPENRWKTRTMSFRQFLVCNQGLIRRRNRGLLPSNMLVMSAEFGCQVKKKN